MSQGARGESQGDGEKGSFSVPMALSEPRGTLKEPFSPSPWLTHAINEWPIGPVGDA